MPRLQGAYSTVVMTKRAVVAFRDPHGVRPLSLGKLGDQLLRRVRELRLRHHRRRAGARGSAGRADLDRRARARDATGRRAEAPGALRLRAHLLLAARHPARGQGAPGGPRRRWARSSGARRLSTPTS